MPDTTHESQPSMNAQSHAAAAPIVVRLRGATKTYPNGLRALEPIDLCVREGELTTLLGPSGCGKSTLLRMVAKSPCLPAARLRCGRMRRLRTPRRTKRSGSRSFSNADPDAMGERRAQREPALALAGSGTAQRSERVYQALELVGLQEFRAHHPRQLSGGMQMRASIARALVTEPPCC
jgi:NitT/TauT family transport system ATP-binding protein